MHHAYGAAGIVLVSGFRDLTWRAVPNLALCKPDLCKDGFVPTSLKKLPLKRDSPEGVVPGPKGPRTQIIGF